MDESIELQQTAEQAEAARPLVGFNWLAWSGLFFAFVQSVCSALIALSGVRFLIGFAAFTSAAGYVQFAGRLHIEAIRLPMMFVALAGAVINLGALWQVWRLRRREASAWRKKTVPAKKRNAERLQFALSVLTLLLLAAEYFAHWKLKGSGL